MEKEIHHWTEEEKKIFKRYYPILPLEEMVEKLGRTQASIAGMAHIMKIYRYPICLQEIMKERLENGELEEYIEAKTL